MSAVVTPHKPLRWSSMRACPRKAVLEATGAPAREPDDRERRIMWRGHSLEDDYARWLIADPTVAPYGKRSVRRQVKVRWEFGTGHVDIYLTQQRTAIEVLSSAHASDAMVHGKLLQLVGYMRKWKRPRAGMVVVLDPSDMSQEQFPIVRRSKAYRALVAEAEERIAEVQRWRDTSELPARVCRKPNDAIGLFCRVADHCFYAEPPLWEPPAPVTETDDEQLVAAATELHAIKAERSALAAEDKRLEKAQKAQQQLLAEALGDPVDLFTADAVDARVGPWVVKESRRLRRGSFQVDKAEAAGVFDPDAYADFFKPDTRFSVWDIEEAA